MKIFFDEDVPRKLVRALPSYDISTVVSMQWGGIKNGALLALIEREGFNVFFTGDKNMQNQQSLAGRPFAVLINVRDQLAGRQAPCYGNRRRPRLRATRHCRARRLRGIRTALEVRDRVTSRFIKGPSGWVTIR